MDLYRITSWLWCLKTDIVQAYAVREDATVHLVDASTAGQEDAILEALARELGVAVADVRLGDVLVTHHHADHYGSAAALADRTGARVLAPAIDAPVITGERPPAAAHLLDWEKPLFEAVMAIVPPAPPVAVDLPLSPGDTLPWARDVELVAAPGHTAGQLAAWFPAERVLLAADAIANVEGLMVGVFNVDPAEAARTFRALAELPSDVACFGHGEPLLADAQRRLAAVAARS